MQKYCTELTDKLLLSVDQDYNVTNMGVVVEVITALEKTTITKEALESTRLGKHINELRRKTSNDALAKRAKDLVRRWRGMLLPPAQTNLQATTGGADTTITTTPMTLNGTNTQNLALRNLKPQSPLLKTNSFSRVSSPSLSVHSDQSSRSPVISPIKTSLTALNNHRFNSNSSQLEIKGVGQNHVQEAVPRTHSSNKRLRKDDPIVIDVEPVNKKQRLNGEIVSSCSENNINSQVPSPTLKERNPELVEPCLITNDDVTIVKKRGRKKGSKSIKKQVSVEDSVKEKLASFSRNPKLKTTQELLADLQARGSNSNLLLPSHSVKSRNVDDIFRTKKDSDNNKYPLVNNKNNINNDVESANFCESSSPNFIESDNVDEDTRDSVLTVNDDTEIIKSQIKRDQTVEEILAKLPPLDYNSIDWGEDEKQYTIDVVDGENENDKIKREISEDDIKRLHSECIESLNGNFQPKFCTDSGDFDKKKDDDDEVIKVELNSVVGLKKSSDSHKDEVFREWHEMLARPTCDGQILHILPYVIID